MNKSIITPKIAYNIACDEIKKGNKANMPRVLELFDQDNAEHTEKLSMLLHDCIKAKNPFALNNIIYKNCVNVNVKANRTENTPLFTAVEVESLLMLEEVMLIPNIDFFAKNACGINFLAYAFIRKSKPLVAHIKRYLSVKPYIFEPLLADALEQLNITNCKSIECLEVYFFGNEEQEAICLTKENPNEEDLSVIDKFAEELNQNAHMSTEDLFQIIQDDESVEKNIKELASKMINSENTTTQSARAVLQ